MIISPEDRYSNSLPEPDEKFGANDFELSPVDEDAHIIEPSEAGSNLTREQELLEIKRVLYNKIKSGNLYNIQFSAEHQNIVKDLLKERGIDIKDEVLESVASVYDQETHFHVFTLDGEVLGFPKNNDLKVVVQPVRYIDGGINIGEVAGVEVLGEEAKKLFDKYKPNQLSAAVMDAAKLLDHEKSL